MQQPEKISRCKRKKLNEYAERSPKKFVEYDAIDVGVDCLDNIMRPDADGHYLCSRETIELMSGVPVRVLVNPKTPRAIAIALLRKILDAVEAEYAGYPDGCATQSIRYR
jgi:hypothetical protein